MDKYSKILKLWESFYNTYAYEVMPFFLAIVDEFYDTNAVYITAEEMKTLIVHYKNVFNLYKNELRNKEFSEFPGLNPYFLLKRIKREYENMLLIYANLLNIEDMNSVRYKRLTRTTTKINR